MTDYIFTDIDDETLENFTERTMCVVAGTRHMWRD
jgi:hypothetical protein